MELVIRAQSLHQKSVSQSIVGEFDERGGTIGRSDSNTMTLPDPERHVSRLQAEVSFAAGKFSLRNVGSANPIIVNGRPLDPGDVVTLGHQDQLVIGGFELRVDLRSHAARASRPATDAGAVVGASAREEKTGPPRQDARARAAAPWTASAPVDPFAELLSGPVEPGAVDPFADLLGPQSPPMAARGASKPSASMDAAPPRLPDDFDPFAGPDVVTPPPDIPARAAAQTPLQDVLGPSASGPGIDTVFGLHGAASHQTDPVAEFMSPETRADAPATTDPFAFLGGNGMSQSEAVGPAAADHTSDLNAAYLPPPVRAAIPAPQPAPLTAAPVPLAQRAPAGPVTEAEESALWHAFLDGAQLALPAGQRLTPEFMHVLGDTLRQAVEGTLQLSAMRTMVKQELHVPVTTIRAKGNNPLKFAPDATAALTQLLQPPLRGFMGAPEAMQDAMTDLIGHTVGTMEGMRAAMQGMLARFEPSQLEAQLAGGSMLDKLVPSNRRAQLWALYLQHYGNISESAREDFDELFGKAFAKAYEEHADRVATARRSRR